MVVRIASLVLIALIGGAGLARAQPSERREAAAHFSRGEHAQAAGNYREAIAAYEQAYALVPHANAVFNIAVCYEKLEDWALAAEYYERYLDEQGGAASDAAAVTEKIRVLRAKSGPAAPPPVADEPSPPSPDPGLDPEPSGVRDGAITDRPAPPIAPPTAPRSRWQAGLSYGLGFGDAPVERYLAYAGMRFARRVDLAGIVGKFGKNDHALGVMGRLVLARTGLVTPFVRGVVTIGYAKQDASSSAETRFPIGIEAGGGVQLGAAGKLELGAVVRWTRGGWDMTTTTADSYANDAIAFAIDLGVVWDFALIAGAR